MSVRVTAGSLERNATCQRATGMTLVLSDSTFVQPVAVESGRSTSVSCRLSSGGMRNHVPSSATGRRGAEGAGFCTTGAGLSLQASRESARRMRDVRMVPPWSWITAEHGASWLEARGGTVRQWFLTGCLRHLDRDRVTLSGNHEP